jgi:uncharacterized membrane protein
MSVMSPLRAPVSPAARGERDHRTIALTGLATAILIPIVGFVIGVALLARRRHRIALVCLVLSITVFFLWIDVLVPDESNLDFDIA